MKKLRLSAVLTAILMLAVTVFVPTFGVSAEGTVEDIVPDWFNADQATTWWATDKFEGSDNWRFNIEVNNGVWKYTQHSNLYDYGIATNSYDATQYDIDLTKTPYLNFASEMVGESYYLKLRCRDNENGGAEKVCNVAFVQAGKQTVSVDLTQNYEIMKAAGTNKKLHLYSVQFTTDKFGGNESLSFSNFRFSATKDVNKNERYWLDEVSEYNWYTGDGKNKDGGYFDVKYNKKGFLQLHINDDGIGDDRTNIDNNIKGVFRNEYFSRKKIDLNTFGKFHYSSPYLYAKVDISLMVMYMNPNSENDDYSWNDLRFIKIGTTKSGACDGYFDLLNNAELLAVANAKKQIYVRGIELTVWYFSEGQDVNFADLSFRMADDVSADCSFEDGGTRISTSDDSDTFTVSANITNLSGTDAIKYQWYIDGELSDKTGATVTLDNTTVGKHTVRSVVTVGDVPYYNTKFFESETYIYGKYIAGNVSMSGELGIGDMVLLRKNLLGAVSFGEIESLAADINSDGKTDLLDLINMKKALAGI